MRIRNGGQLLLSAVLTIGLANAPSLHAQSTQRSGASQAAADWETAAGGKMQFDAASVKPDTTARGAGTVHSNVDLTSLPGFAQTGGLFSAANYPLAVYASFAFKLTTDQTMALGSSLPKWALEARYDIEARAAGNPTKDQYRLMMQALLADRFKLAVHFEKKDVPVLGLALDKSGKLGPKIRVHTEDPPCPDQVPTTFGEAATVAGGFPQPCGVLALLQSPATSGRARVGARGVSMAMIAGLLSSQQGLGLDRPVVDRTGLSGTFDFILDFAPQTRGPVPPGPNDQTDASAPTFLEALKEELGLKLESGQTATLDRIVLDHIEPLSAN